MCKIVEDYANEVSLENARKFFEKGCSLEMVIACIENIPEEILTKLYEEVVGAKSVV